MFANKNEVDCSLALADGTVFKGKAFGYVETAEIVTGEVVFNTALGGYQEIMTDPSYAGQMITFTCPHIGNVGCNDEDYESSQVYARAAIVRQLSPIVSNFRSQYSFSDFLNKEKVIGISGIDTRALVQHIRDCGAQMAALQVGKVNSDTLIDHARAAGSMEGKDYVREVSCKKSYNWAESVWSLESGYQLIPPDKAVPKVVVIDCGVKRNILRLLASTGFRITVMPADSTAEQILAEKPDALFLSNGPGDPATLDYVVKPVKELLGKLPIFGICLGHQILSQAFGAKTYKLKFGHRGGNHPVMDLKTQRVEITVQNHGFAVDPETLGKDAVVSHLNLNDQTIEGVASDALKAFAVQYHPEANPGPHDSNYLFQRFYDLVVN